MVKQDYLFPVEIMNGLTITDIRFNFKDKSKLIRASATVILNGILVVNGIKIYTGKQDKDSLILYMPNFRKDDDSERGYRYFDFIHPINQEVRTKFESIIFDRYRSVYAMFKERGFLDENDFKVDVAVDEPKEVIPSTPIKKTTKPTKKQVIEEVVEPEEEPVKKKSPVRKKKVFAATEPEVVTKPTKKVKKKVEEIIEPEEEPVKKKSPVKKKASTTDSKKKVKK